jgi:hypothetical protein
MFTVFRDIKNKNVIHFKINVEKYINVRTRNELYLVSMLYPPMVPRQFVGVSLAFFCLFWAVELSVTFALRIRARVVTIPFYIVGDLEELSIVTVQESSPYWLPQEIVSSAVLSHRSHCQHQVDLSFLLLSPPYMWSKCILEYKIFLPGRLLINQKIYVFPTHKL